MEKVCAHFESSQLIGLNPVVFAIQNVDFSFVMQFAAEIIWHLKKNHRSEVRAR